MRKLMTVCLMTVALGIGASTTAIANTLPSAACNDGTMNAHESVPATTGTGVMTPAHEHIPELSGDTCSH